MTTFPFKEKRSASFSAFGTGIGILSDLLDEKCLNMLEWYNCRVLGYLGRV